MHNSCNIYTLWAIFIGHFTITVYKKCLNSACVDMDPTACERMEAAGFTPGNTVHSIIETLTNQFAKNL